jgi:hypothetical protein
LENFSHDKFPYRARLAPYGNLVLLQSFLHKPIKGIYLQKPRRSLIILSNSSDCKFHKEYTNVSIRWPVTRDRQFFPADGTPHQQKEVL